MESRKRNEFLEASGSDDEVESQRYDSEVEDPRKGGRSAKRQKVHSEMSDDDDDNELLTENNEAKASTTLNPIDSAESEQPNTLAKLDQTARPQKQRPQTELTGISKPITKRNLVATEKALKRSGVVYLSRIPPFMKPSKLRSLLEPYGALNRIFMTPEDPASHTRRVRAGGNKKRSFTDGWVEWLNKSDAKKACELLNARPIGGKKGSYYRDDVWNLLYLKNFKWNNLTEQIAAENAERASRMRAEISKSTKENKEFVKNVERAKMLEGMAGKKAAKRRREERDDGEEGGADVSTKVKKAGERPRQFKQREVAPKKTFDQPEEVKRVLSKIF